MNKKNKLKTFIERNKKSNGYLLRKTSFNVFYKIIRFVLLFGLCFMILQPLLNKISISFMEEQDLYDSTIVAIPRHFTLSNYQIAAYLMKYWQALANTALISLLVSVLQIISCTLVGYGFARYKFPLKGLWFAAVILVIVVPPTTIQASLFLNFRFFDIFGIIELITGQPGVNLLNSLTPYALMCLGCMGLKSGLYIYMIRQFFRGIPKELEEAAKKETSLQEKYDKQEEKLADLREKSKKDLADAKAKYTQDGKKLKEKFETAKADLVKKYEAAKADINKKVEDGTAEWKEKYEQGESERGELKAKLEAAERRITDLESRNRKGKR